MQLSRNALHCKMRVVDENRSEIWDSEVPVRHVLQDIFDFSVFKVFVRPITALVRK